jgi:hypothetical protein
LIKLDLADEILEQISNFFREFSALAAPLNYRAVLFKRRPQRTIKSLKFLEIMSSKAICGPSRQSRDVHGVEDAPDTPLERENFLPPELLGMACQYLGPKPLKKLCFASRFWHSIAFVHLLRRIDTSTKGIDVVKLAALAFNTHLKHIKIALLISRGGAKGTPNSNSISSCFRVSSGWHSVCQPLLSPSRS